MCEREIKELFLMMDNFCRRERNEGDCEECSCKECPMNSAKQIVKNKIKEERRVMHDDDEEL